LHGTIDILVETGAEVIPIEHKLSRGPVSQTHRVQLCAYGLLAEAAYGLPARRAFVYWIPSRRASEVPITEQLREQTLALVAAVQCIHVSEVLPEATIVAARCTDCEFRRFCGDRPRPT
jgi:CRISPR-associated exonuclease Cas4